MTKSRTESPEERQASLAPETHNSEQDDHLAQAQEVAAEARAGDSHPGDSEKERRSLNLTEDSTQDTVDHMRNMVRSGRIDMGAFAGEPNHDDEDDTYGPGHDPDSAEE